MADIDPPPRWVQTGLGLVGRNVWDDERLIEERVAIFCHD